MQDLSVGDGKGVGVESGSPPIYDLVQSVSHWDRAADTACFFTAPLRADLVMAIFLTISEIPFQRASPTKVCSPAFCLWVLYSSIFFTSNI